MTHYWKIQPRFTGFKLKMPSTVDYREFIKGLMVGTIMVGQYTAMRDDDVWYHINVEIDYNEYKKNYDLVENAGIKLSKALDKLNKYLDKE